MHAKTTPTRSVAALIVTYADRRRFLERLLARLATMPAGPDAIVVVFNGVPYDPVAWLAERSGLPPVVVHRHAANLGSAAGVAQGLATAHARTAAEWFWLLDDDLDPAPDALVALRRALEQLRGDRDAALLSLRTDRCEFVQTARGERDLRAVPDSFFGFALADKLAAARRRRPRAPQPDLPAVDYAPWGGLLLHRSWHTRIGPPRADFFVYADDHEYTIRLTRAGGRVLLCAASQLAEQETSYNRGQRPGRHVLFDDAASEPRTYLALRNRVALERALLVSSRWRYWLNAAGFAVLALARSPAMWARPRPLARRTALLVRAIRDGWTGRLGMPATGAAMQPPDAPSARPLGADAPPPA